MESNAFSSSHHLPSQALVVLSEAASGLHEALRGHRPFPSRISDAKDLHNMSLVGSYGSHLLHSFHPHLLQTLNHGMLSNSNSAASYFASERGKPVLSNFQLPSAFSPPKYIGISIDQNIFNGSESYRTDSASPTCTSHESVEGSNDYDGEKGESPRSSNSDPRDLRHVHTKASSSCVTTSAMSATLVSTSAAVSAASLSVTNAHLSHQLVSHQHHHHHHHQASGNNLLAASMESMGLTPSSCGALRVVTSSGLTPMPMRAGNGLGNLSGTSSNFVPDVCPVCGIKLTGEEWNSHFLAELDRLYKLSSGMERASLQASYMFAPLCPTQENAIRTSHSRWETFQRIRSNRQNRIRIKVRKRKYGADLYFMENLFCNSCPICKRKYGIETAKLQTEDEQKLQDEIETVDVESCNDDVPDSGSEVQANSQQNENGNKHSANFRTCLSNAHSSSTKQDGTTYVINKPSLREDEVVTTNTFTCNSRESVSVEDSNSISGSTSWTETNSINTPGVQGHISVKSVNELSSTTRLFCNADSCADEADEHSYRIHSESCNNDSDEDVIVDDDDSIKMIHGAKKRKHEEIVGSRRTSENQSPMDERPRSEPQVTSTEPNVDIATNIKYSTFEDAISRHRQKRQQQMEPDNSYGSLMLPGIKQFNTKTDINAFSKESSFRGRNSFFYPLDDQLYVRK